MKFNYIYQKKKKKDVASSCRMSFSNYEAWQILWVRWKLNELSQLTILIKNTKTSLDKKLAEIALFFFAKDYHSQK